MDKATNIHTSMTRHEFAKKHLKYNLPHIINGTPELVLKCYLQFTWVCVLLKKLSLKKMSKLMYNIGLLHMSVKYTVISILICTYMD